MFANIGLARSAVVGTNWTKTHRPTLLRQFVDLLLSEERPAGLLLNEVCNLSDLLNADERSKYSDLLIEAFHNAGASEHGRPKIVWSGGETVAAFRSEVKVQSLTKLTFNATSRVDTWRVVERFELIGAAEHGPCSLLVYNQHQPASDSRPF